MVSLLQRPANVFILDSPPSSRSWWPGVRRIFACWDVPVHRARYFQDLTTKSKTYRGHPAWFVLMYLDGLNVCYDAEPDGGFVDLEPEIQRSFHADEAPFFG